jgi:hypothetical protein
LGEAQLVLAKAKKQNRTATARQPGQDNQDKIAMKKKYSLLNTI